MSKRVKQSADILNSKESIKRKKAERKEKQIKTKLDKKNKTENTKGKRQLKKTKKGATNKEQDNTNKKIIQRNKHYFSENDEDVLADLCDKENDNYLKVNQCRASLKRKNIYSSNTEDDDNPPNYEIEGKKTEGLPVKILSEMDRITLKTQIKITT